MRTVDEIIHVRFPDPDDIEELVVVSVPIIVDYVEHNNYGRDSTCFYTTMTNKNIIIFT